MKYACSALLALLAAACTRAPTAMQTTAAPLARTPAPAPTTTTIATAESCPLKVEPSFIAVTEVPNGAAIVFTADQPTELRQELSSVAERHNQASTNAATANAGTGAADAADPNAKPGVTSPDPSATPPPGTTGTPQPGSSGTTQPGSSAPTAPGTTGTVTGEPGTDPTTGVATTTTEPPAAPIPVPSEARVEESTDGVQLVFTTDQNVQQLRAEVRDWAGELNESCVASR